ncbi:MAG: L-type lectin-domain containing protein [Candidatus Acidiferrales bacterium]
MAVMQRYAFALAVLFVFSLVLAFGAAPVFAQGFNFPNFSSRTNLTLNGNAAPSGTGTSTVLRLTPNVAGQVGSVWFNTQQVVSNGFTTTFQFRISNPSTPPADGLAFVIQNSAASTTAIGPGGGGIGYGTNLDSSGTGITDSLAVEFDTFQNTGDPNANHVAVQSCGTGANSSDETALFGDSETPCNLGTNSELPITLADGNVHTVVINYDPTSSDACDGGPALKVYLDGNTPVLRACVNVATRLSLGTGGTAWVGFTGATGADDEDNDILNWSFTPHRGQTTNVILNFTPSQPSQVAKFNCTTFNENGSCADPEAHSLKLTASQVGQPFSLVVSSTIVDGDGSCESGIADDPADPNDCRYVNHFGTPGTPPAVTVPLCDPYFKDSNNVQHCVYYRIENPPDTSLYQGPIYWYIAWNDDTFVTSGACAAVTFPTTYQCGNRQMADDPSSPPHADANQYTQYITTYFNGSGGQVGFDPGLGGGSKNFNDVEVVFPQTVPNVKLFLFAPQPNTHVEQTDRLPIIFLLLKGSRLITNATVPPNVVNVTVLDSSGAVKQVVAPGSPLPNFSLFFGFYVLGLDTSQLTPGSYQLRIDSNLFAQQTIPFTVVPED